MKDKSPELEKLLLVIDKGLEITGMSASGASKQAVNHPSLIKNMFSGQEPRFTAIMRLCEVLGLECYIGPPRCAVVRQVPSYGLISEWNGNMEKQISDSLAGSDTSEAPASVPDTAASFMIATDRLQPTLMRGDRIIVDIGSPRPAEQCDRRLCLIITDNGDGFIQIVHHINGATMLQSVTGQDKAMPSGNIKAIYPILWVDKSPHPPAV